MSSENHRAAPTAGSPSTTEKLRRSEERYRLLVESTREYAMLMLDADGVITDWNHGAERLFGYTEDDVRGRHGAIIFTEEDRERNAPEREMTTAAERGWARDERWHLRKDGSRFWGTGTMEALRTPEGRLRGFAKILRDNTRRKSAEEALKKKDRLLDAILDQMPSGVAIAEAPSGKLLFHNAEAVRLLRHPMLPSEDYTGYAQYGALHADGTPYAPEHYPIARALDGELVHQEDMHYRRGDGTLTLFSVNAAPVRDEHGTIVRAVSTFHDISELKEAQEELRQLNRTLEKRVEERTEQVRTMASRLTMAEQAERRRVSQILHDDLQQLLYGIEMKLSLLHEEMAPMEHADLLREIEGTRSWIRRAIRTTRQLSVDLSPPILKSDDLAESLRWLQRQMKELHELDVSVTADRSPALLDRDLHILLFQIVRELLFNVKKHAGVDCATLRIAEEAGHTVIHVVDDGHGFSVEEATAREQQGNSFGLFSVRERLKLKGGHLDVRSAPGRGTHIKVYAPASSSPPAAAGDD